jgi:hypothetical protein
MTRKPPPHFLLACIGAALVFMTPAQADEIISNTSSYDSPGYDFVDTFPPATTTIGTYNFTPLELSQIVSITISGTFGNGDSPTTALSDYYLGFAGDETAVTVANCDSTVLNPFPDCSSGSGGPWNATLTEPQIDALAAGLEAGSLDFTYTWDTPLFEFEGLDQYVYAGATTLDIQTTPEPSTVLFCLGGLAGVVMLRRFRKV